MAAAASCSRPGRRRAWVRQWQGISEALLLLVALLGQRLGEGRERWRRHERRRGRDWPE